MRWPRRQELARRASALGMRPNPYPAFLVMPKGKVIGKPRPVTGNEVPEPDRQDRRRAGRGPRRRARAEGGQAAAKAAKEKAAAAAAKQKAADRRPRRRPRLRPRRRPRRRPRPRRRRRRRRGQEGRRSSARHGRATADGRATPASRGRKQSSRRLRSSEPTARHRPSRSGSSPQHDRGERILRDGTVVRPRKAAPPRPAPRRPRRRPGEVCGSRWPPSPPAARAVDRRRHRVCPCAAVGCSSCRASTRPPTPRRDALTRTLPLLPARGEHHRSQRRWCSPRPSRPSR